MATVAQAESKSQQLLNEAQEALKRQIAIELWDMLLLLVASTTPGTWPLWLDYAFTSGNQAQAHSSINAASGASLDTWASAVHAECANEVDNS